mmetsp:Transcript_122697/g.392173  ORF Transcript_122697/g.392173 Transcript_122697/m.392173 type:complete len:201 (-) Transcript_122697:164-766(-)
MRPLSPPCCSQQTRSSRSTAARNRRLRYHTAPRIFWHHLSARHAPLLNPLDDVSLLTVVPPMGFSVVSDICSPSKSRSEPSESSARTHISWHHLAARHAPPLNPLDDVLFLTVVHPMDLSVVSDICSTSESRSEPSGSSSRRPRHVRHFVHRPATSHDSSVLLRLPSLQVHLNFDLFSRSCSFLLTTWDFSLRHTSSNFF